MNIKWFLSALMTISCMNSLAEQAPETETGTQISEFSQRVEWLADGIVSSVMAENNIPGLTLSVVKDGNIVLTKGYGYADAPDKIPVDPDNTLFRIGSVSKTFTWTAVMQLVEQGKLDLNENVNHYLKTFQLPEPNGAPLTLNDMMAHRPGYEDGALGYLFADNPEGVISLEEWLQKYMPAQVRAPGEAVSYSNYASALAGLIVQEVSGQDFNDYVEAHILEPLQMHHTSFREPLGADHPEQSIAKRLENDFAVGHTRQSGQHIDAGFEYIHQVGPAGSASSTATDMAHYMIAHLQKGHFGDKRILREKTAEQMRQRNFTDRMAMTDFAHGFFHSKIAGYDAYGHGGATLVFKTIMQIFPELQFGVFVSINQGPGTLPVYHIPELLVKNLFPNKNTLANPKPPADFAERGKRFVGTYMNNRRSFTGLEKLSVLDASPAKVSVDDEGYLLIADGDVSAWVEIAPLTFRNVENDSVVVFDEDSNGNILRYNGERGHASYEKISFFETPAFLKIALGVMLFFSITTLLGAWRRRIIANVSAAVDGSKSHWSARLAFWCACGGVLLGLSVAFAVQQVSTGGSALLFHFPPSSLVFTIWVALIVSLMLLFLLLSVVPAWKIGEWSLWRKLHHSLFALAGVMLIVGLWQWNLLGFNY